MFNLKATFPLAEKSTSFKNRSLLPLMTVFGVFILTSLLAVPSVYASSQTTNLDYGTLLPYAEEYTLLATTTATFTGTTTSAQFYAGTDDVFTHDTASGFYFAITNLTKGYPSPCYFGYPSGTASSTVNQALGTYDVPTLQSFEPASFSVPYCYFEIGDVIQYQIQLMNSGFSLSTRGTAQFFVDTVYFELYSDYVPPFSLYTATDSVILDTPENYATTTNTNVDYSFRYRSGDLAGTSLKGIYFTDVCTTDNYVLATSTVNSLSTGYQTATGTVSLFDNTAYNVVAFIKSDFTNEIYSQTNQITVGNPVSCADYDTLFGGASYIVKSLSYKFPWGYFTYVRNLVVEIGTTDNRSDDLTVDFTDTSFPVRLNVINEQTLFSWEWIRDSKIYPTVVFVSEWVSYLIWLGFVAYVWFRIKNIIKNSNI